MSNDPSSTDEPATTPPSQADHSNATDVLPTGILEEHRCPECNSPIERTNNETYCANCGLVIETVEQPQQNFRREIDNKPDRRQSGPATHPELTTDLSTTIGWVSATTFDSYSSDRQEEIKRLRRTDSQIQFTSKTRNLAEYGWEEISRMGTSLGLGRPVIKQAIHLFKQAHKAGLAVGRTIEGLAAASLYLTAKVNQLPVLQSAIADVARVSVDQINIATQAINQELKIEVPPQSPQQFIHKFCADLELPPRAEQVATTILTEIEGTQLVNGTSPSATAAAAIYAAGRLLDEDVEAIDITQAEVADVAGTTTSVIQDRWAGIKDEVGKVRTPYEM